MKMVIGADLVVTRILFEGDTRRAWKICDQTRTGKG